MDAAERQYLSEPGHGEGPQDQAHRDTSIPLTTLSYIRPHAFGSCTRFVPDFSEPHFLPHTPYRLDGLDTSLVVRVTEPLPVYLPAFEGIA